MAYAKQTWANGDIITAEKMNHIEDGIESASSGGGIFSILFTYTDDMVHCSKTYAEMLAEYQAHGTENMIATCGEGYGGAICYLLYYWDNYGDPYFDFYFMFINESANELGVYDIKVDSNDNITQTDGPLYELTPKS